MVHRTFHLGVFETNGIGEMKKSLRGDLPPNPYERVFKRRPGPVPLDPYFSKWFYSQFEEERGNRHWQTPFRDVWAGWQAHCERKKWDPKSEKYISMKLRCVGDKWMVRKADGVYLYGIRAIRRPTEE